MDKIKAFYDKNKKIVIPVAIVLVLLIAVGIYFISQPNSDTNKKVETQTEEKADISKDDKKEEDKNKDSEDKKADKKDTADNSNAPAQNDNAPASKPSGNTNTGNSGGSASNSGSSKPAHSHSWKNHTATKQVWVSKIVPVYETQTVQVGTEKVSLGAYWHCSGCGAEIQGANSNPATRDHIMAHIKAGEADNGYVFEKFTEKPIYETKQVQVGTKDEGHYETQSYTDYQYCDCGAKK